MEIRRADPYIQRCVRDLAELGIRGCLFRTHGTAAADGDSPPTRTLLEANLADPPEVLLTR
ncbi:hypothetical protein [Streptomyces shaanxiensis]|uniref:Uncharacterized protein n=1 Tax=Streptomyces shaanxiensis TaxID=653357 RepID=A0ABP7UDF6_9ACTN